MSTTKIFTNNRKQRFGLISMMSMIVGIVIGSGIFFKNQSMWDTTQSVMLTMIVWMVISVIVFLMIIGFLEVASASKRTGTSGTVSNWTTTFIGPKMGKMIGFFFTFIYAPVSFAILVVVFGSQIMSGVEYSFGASFEPWIKYGVLTAVGIVLFIVVAMINTFTNKPGKIMQVVGTGIKLTPLLLIIFSVFSLMFTNPEIMDSFVDVWDPNNSTYNPLFTDPETNSTSILLVLVTALPSVMFSYDGFLSAAAVQNEAKTKNTYMISLFSGMLFVIFIYVLVSLFIFAGADWTNSGASGNFGIPGVISNIFPSAKGWLPFLMSVIIAISVLTSISGSFISSSRGIATLSEKNYVVDKEGRFLKRNKALVPQGSAIAMIKLSIIWFIFLSTLDAVGTYQNAPYTFLYTDFAANAITIFSFTTYATLLIAMCLNRRRQRVEVDRIKGAGIAGWIASISLFAITIMYSYTLLSPETLTSIFGEWNATTMTIYALQITIIVLYILIVWFLYSWNTKKVRKTDSLVFKHKEMYVRAFNNYEVWTPSFDHHHRNHN